MGHSVSHGFESSSDGWFWRGLSRKVSVTMSTTVTLSEGSTGAGDLPSGGRTHTALVVPGASSEHLPECPQNTAAGVPRRTTQEKARQKAERLL